MNSTSADRLRRREALQWMAGTGLAALGMTAGARGNTAPQGGAATGQPATADFRAAHITAQLQRLAPNVYAFVQHEGPGESGTGLSNAGVIAGPNHLLGIDSTAAPLQAQQLIAQAHQATGKNFRRVVLTHAHPDHFMGLQFFGDVDIIAQENCRPRVEYEETTQDLQRFWTRHEGWSLGTDRFQPRLPNITYRERMTLYDYGATEVRLLYLGRGHTGADTVVHLPNERIAFIGDIGFFKTTPMGNSAYFSDWIAVCDKLLAMPIDTYVPGHGPVGGRADLTDTRDYLALITREARKFYDAGASPARAAIDMNLGKFADWPDVDRITNNVTRLYQAFAGKATVNIDFPSILQTQKEYEALGGRKSHQR